MDSVTEIDKMNTFNEAVESMFDTWWDSLSSEDKLVQIETERGKYCHDGIDSCTIKFVSDIDAAYFYEFLGDSPEADKFARENNFTCSTKFFDEMLETYKKQNEENWIEEYLGY